MKIPNPIAAIALVVCGFCSNASPAAAAGAPFPGDPSVSFVEVTCTKITELHDHIADVEFTISHVYAGTVENVGCRFHEAASTDTSNENHELLWPAPRLNQRGLWLLQDGGNGQVIPAWGPVPGKVNLLDDGSADFKQLMELAKVLEAFTLLPKERQLDALQNYLGSKTEQIIMWARVTYPREFPESFIRYSHEKFEHGVSTISEDIWFDTDLPRVDKGWSRSPLRVRMFAKWAKANPSQSEARAITYYLAEAIGHAVGTNLASLLSTSSSILANKSYPVAARVYLVEWIGMRSTQEPGASVVKDMLRSVAAASDERALVECAEKYLGPTNHPTTQPGK